MLETRATCRRRRQAAHSPTSPLDISAVTATRATTNRLRATLALLAVIAGLLAVSAATSGPTAVVAGPPAAFADEITLAAGKLRTAFGGNLALSRDGTTVIVGAPRDNRYHGIAWVYTKRGANWESHALVGDLKEPGEFGQSVALSADGRIAVVGAPNDDDHKGSAWVFRSIGGGTWVGSKLSPRGAEDDPSFGFSVAASADGSKVLVGGHGDDKRAVVGVTGRGAVWTFVRSGNRWAQQGRKLTPPSSAGRGNFGWAVAMSGDGSTALVGAPAVSDDDGAAWLYQWSGSKWGQVGGRIFFAQADRPVRHFGSWFGFGVALSYDGSAGIIGAPLEPANNRAGAAYIIERTETGWRKVARLLGGGEQGQGQFGRTVALSGEGTTALIGGLTDNRNKGAAWAFMRSGGAWSQDGAKFTRGAGLFASSIAIATDGGRALFAGSQDGRAVAFLFLNAPVVAGVNPLRGPTAGGTSVRIIGSGFTGVRAVKFGTTPATSFTVDSPKQITAVSPPGAAGAVDITVRTSVGTSPTAAVGRFTYVGGPTISGLAPASGPSSGGTTVVITGTNLSNATAVSFGSSPAASFKVDTSTRITAVAPPGTGAVAVAVTTPGGTSGVTTSSRFTYTTLRTVAFDNLVTGGPEGLLTAVTSQYAGQGVTFSNASAVDYSKGGAAIPGFAHSGAIAVEPCAGVEFCTDPLRANFSAPQFAARVWVGCSVSLNQAIQVQLRAYDGSGVLVGTASVTLAAGSTPTPITMPLEVRRTSRIIRRIDVLVPGGFNNYLAIDDVAFEQ